MLNPNNVRMQTQLITVAELNDFVYYNNVITEGVRNIRWSVRSQSRYIESLLLRMPVSPIYITQATYDNDDEYSYGDSHIIDGVQRVRSILRFRNNRYRLRGMEYSFGHATEEKRYNELHESLRTRIEETYIPIHLIENTTPAEVTENLANRLNMRHLQPRSEETRDEDTNQRESPF